MGIGSYLKTFDNSLIVGTMHANAAPNAPYDVNYALSQLGNIQKFIVGGDFNCNPIQLRGYTGTQSRPGVIYSIEAPVLPTHKGGETLDYFIYNDGLGIKVQAIPADVPHPPYKISRIIPRDIKSTGGSDHIPVAVVVEY